VLEGWDPTEIVACALRPEGSWMHMLALAGFVLATWSVSPKAGFPRARRATRYGVTASSIGTAESEPDHHA
jgi:hypothetical protein